MKKLLLLFGFICLASFSQASATGSSKSDGLLNKSSMSSETTPIPFNAEAITQASPAISTGYYFVDSDETNLPAFWRINKDIVPLDFEPNLWKRILSGPRQVDSTYWDNNPSEGLAFFRNPGKPTNNSYFRPGIAYGTDSTNDAFAGPIPLNLNEGFYFNGIRYDSFYVSTNGVIALTNRRYFYDATGGRTIPPGATTCYDPMSMDWFATGRTNRLEGVASLTDPTPDNFGYQFSALGNNKNGLTAGIRAKNPGEGLDKFEPANKAALIAPFWGPLQFVQWEKVLRTPIDQSRVFYKKSTAKDKLIIYIQNVQPEKGTHNLMQSSYTAPEDGRVGQEFQAIDASVQVVLNRLDSSVTFQYERFRGNVTLQNKAQPGAHSVFQGITYAGVRGFARHVNYDGVNVPASPWATDGEYMQTTHFNKKVDPLQGSIYRSGQHAVRFKQYKNTLRVIDTKFKVRKKNRAADNEFTEVINSVDNYELLAGDEKLGAIQPVMTIQNLSNQIQGIKGVNFTPQGLTFRARINIENDVTNTVVYTETINITDSALRAPVASYQKVRLFNPFQPKGVGTEMPYTDVMNGIPPYNCVQVSFKPFIPSELDMRYIGRLKVKIIAEPVNPLTKEKLGDAWPFDDTSSTKLWVMKRIANFKDDVTEFHFLDEINQPSVLKWVNFGAQAVDGDKNSVYPLAPRGRYEDAGKKQQFLESPVIIMDRVGPDGDWDDDQNPKTHDGDELRSFPIDLNGKTNPVLSLSIQRGIQNKENLKRDRGFCDATLVGPEPRTVVNNEASGYPVFAGNQYMGAGVTTATKYVDQIQVDFALPSPDGVNEVTNIDKANWTKLRHVDGTTIVTSAYTLFGAGGYRLGFRENDAETEFKESDSVLTPAQGLRIDFYDDGFDWDYKKIFIPIPSYYTNAAEEIKKNFRFRLKVMAVNHATAHQPAQTIPDDEDPFIIDNVAILADPTEADVEVSSVKIEWPYTAIPASQALSVPITVILSNNSSMDSKSLILRTYITKGADTVYCSNIDIVSIPAGATISQMMPSWNARLTGPGNYRIHSHAHYVGNRVTGKDIDVTNDYNYNDFQMKFAKAFMYELTTDEAVPAQNDVEKTDFLNTLGRGLSLRGASTGGLGTETAYQSGFDYVNHTAGAFSGDGSGQIAVKFELNKPDTLFGYQAYFASYNVENTDITFSIYRDGGAGYVPEITMATGRIAGSVLEKQRGMDELGQPGFDKYSTYLLDNPLLLATGTYWVVIAQKGKNGLELGAKADRMGMRTVVTSAHPQTRELGAEAVTLLVDKSLRKVNPYDGIAYNNNIFAYENIMGSGNWQAFMNHASNPGFPHLEHYGLSPKDQYTFTLTRGTWMPMLRPYFGEKSYGEESINIPCDAPEGVVPVELTEFNAQSRNNGVELYWGTASEHNNKGFYVERASEENRDFSSIAFIESQNGNATVSQQYNYFDKDVVSNKVYTYRLRQVDVDGSNCDSYSQEVKVKFTYGGDVVLEANAPNPFSTSTSIGFRISETSAVKLEVLDMFGSVITTLVDGELKANRHVYNWNGATENGNLVAPGTYVYRLTVNGTVYNSKMTVIR